MQRNCRGAAGELQRNPAPGPVACTALTTNPQAVRKRRSKRAPRGAAVAYRYAGAVRLDDLHDDCQTQTGAVATKRLCPAKKRSKTRCRSSADTLGPLSCTLIAPFGSTSITTSVTGVNRPPGFIARRTFMNAACGSLKNLTPKRENARSKLLGAKGWTATSATTASRRRRSIAAPGRPTARTHRRRAHDSQDSLARPA